MRALSPSSPRAALAAVALAGLVGACRSAEPQIAPEGWIEVYSQDFEHGPPGLDFVFSDPKAWRIGEEDGDHFLEQFAQSDYTPPHRSPLNVGVLAGPYVGDFVLELDVMQTGREYPHRDACVFFGVQDPDHLAYVHMASAADENAHHIQLVDGADRAPVTQHRTFGVQWGEGQWHHVRIERSLALEHVRVWFDGSPEPILTARGALQPGWIGVGTFDDSARFDNIRLFAPPSCQIRSPGFFRPLASR